MLSKTRKHVVYASVVSLDALLKNKKKSISKLTKIRFPCFFPKYGPTFSSFFHLKNLFYSYFMLFTNKLK